MTSDQLEMLKDLHLVTKQGSAGIAIRKGERRKYVALEREGLIWFASGFGRHGTLGVRLTDKGREYISFHFAYAYVDLPSRGKTTYQDQHGNVTLVC